MPDMENPGSVGADTGANDSAAGSRFVVSQHATTGRRSVVDTRSGLVLVAHDLDHDPLADLCRADHGGCGAFGSEVITRASAGPVRCCRDIACPLGVIE